MKTARKVKNFLSGPAALHYALPILMIYLLFGTISQKYIGLYDATEIFFAAPVILIGPVPLPGLPVLLAVIFINLCFKLIFKSPWNAKSAGQIITHIGVFCLLLGGLFTALFSDEGFVDLAQGDQKNFVTDYHAREFVILDEAGNIIQSFAHEKLYPGKTIKPDALDHKIEILEACRNCKITARENADETYQSMARAMKLSPDKPETADEENMAGLTFRIGGNVYVVLENVPKLPAFEGYSFTVRKKRRALPFTIELLEFRRDMHPGTGLAKSYSSRVRIIDGPAQWESLIRMNEPLRYKGYTLFQASFVQAPEGDMSVLAVVRNKGRAFPYIAGITICLGIILHLFTRRRKKA